MGTFSGDLEIGKVVIQISEIGVVCGGGFRSFIGVADTGLSCLIAWERVSAGTLSAISISPIAEARDAAGGLHGRIFWRAFPG